MRPPRTKKSTPPVPNVRKGMHKLLLNLTNSLKIAEIHTLTEKEKEKPENRHRNSEPDHLIKPSANRRVPLSNECKQEKTSPHLILNKIYMMPQSPRGGPQPDAIEEMHCQWEGPLESSKGPRF